jgi:hypothetical protein
MPSKVFAEQEIDVRGNTISAFDAIQIVLYGADTDQFM